LLAVAAAADILAEAAELEDIILEHLQLLDPLLYRLMLDLAVMVGMIKVLVSERTAAIPVGMELYPVVVDMVVEHIVINQVAQVDLVVVVLLLLDQAMVVVSRHQLVKDFRVVVDLVVLIMDQAAAVVLVKLGQLEVQMEVLEVVVVNFLQHSEILSLPQDLEQDHKLVVV
jgi:hypothetical protein